jgi:hypothetical protein
MSNEEQQDQVIFDSSLTLEQLKGYWNYGNDESKAEFTQEEIDKLAEDVNDAIHNVIEDFLNHRSN